LFGASTAYVRQLEKGESYQLLQPVYGLGLIADVFDKDSDEWYHHYKLINIKQPLREIKDLQLVFIELPKFKAASIAHKKLQVLWLRFMSELNNHTIEVPPEWLEVSEIKEAVSLSEEAAYTPVELAAYDKYWDAVSTEKTYLDDAKAEGIAIGKAEGKAEGIAEGEAKGKFETIKATMKAVSLIHQNLDDMTIATQACLDIDVVRKLRASVKH
jgi:predicted transposase/invertase (TIGR01784 family)